MHTRRLDADLDLGPCCACGREGPEVRTLMLLNRKAHIAGTGWGHAATGLPADGAIAVLCDNCLEIGCEPTQVVYGFTIDKERRPIEELAEPFGRDDSDAADLRKAE
ncbi:MAG: hypothetical protein U1F76_15150 [Candidatus Competibacteraceae bacterium]